MVSFDKAGFIERLKKLRKQHAGERGKALFSKELGVNPSTYNYYEKGRMPPVDLLWKICKITNANIHWLLEGETSDNNKTRENLYQYLSCYDKLFDLVKDNPQAENAVTAFIELLYKKTGIEAGPQDDFPKNEPDKQWLPILGRTAAGIIHFWPEKDPLPDITELAEVIHRHQEETFMQTPSVDIQTDRSDFSLIQTDATQVKLIQLTEIPDNGISEFIDCPVIYQRYPDAFGLRADGDSMAPRINDGDILILSPSVIPKDGTTAVVQLKNQIGVTCKIIRQDKNQLHLIPANEKYDVKTFPNEQISWMLAVLWRIRIRAVSKEHHHSPG